MRSQGVDLVWAAVRDGEFDDEPDGAILAAIHDVMRRIEKLVLGTGLHPAYFANEPLDLHQISESTPECCAACGEFDGDHAYDCMYYDRKTSQRYRRSLVGSAAREANTIAQTALTLAETMQKLMDVIGEPNSDGFEPIWRE